jgi:hypothetical protein
MFRLDVFFSASRHSNKLTFSKKETKDFKPGLTYLEEEHAMIMVLILSIVGRITSVVPTSELLEGCWTFYG